MSEIYEEILDKNVERWLEEYMKPPIKTITIYYYRCTYCGAVIKGRSHEEWFRKMAEHLLLNHKVLLLSKVDVSLNKISRELMEKHKIEVENVLVETRLDKDC